MLDLIAGLASIAGLGISIWTLAMATGARRAANEAREAVRKGNAAEELANLSRIADEFLSHVEADQIAAAMVRARDLLSATSLASRRWGRFLSADSEEPIRGGVGTSQQVNIPGVVHKWCSSDCTAER